ncbi:MAG: dihydropteroate synthase, partial [Chloroflexota bacterium]
RALAAAGGVVRPSDAGAAAAMLVLSGGRPALEGLLAALGTQADEGAVVLSAELADVLRALDGPRHDVCRIGRQDFVWGARTYVMGILNITPDSFSGDGALTFFAPSETTLVAVVAQGHAMLAQGADILDVGGESTRPGATPLDADAELARVLPVVRALRAATDAPISIDTYKAAVARAALDAGADLVNDVWGLQMDPDLAPLVAERGVPVVIMHNRSKPKNAAQEARLGGRYLGVHYEDLLGDILRELRQQVASALAAGIAAERILVDPGIGFGKTVEQNLMLLNHADELRVLGYPVLLGPSRKSFIGYTLNLPPDERVEGTAAALVVGMLRGAADVVRVHDVGAIARAVRMADAILGAG